MAPLPGFPDGTRPMLDEARAAVEGAANPAGAAGGCRNPRRRRYSAKAFRRMRMGQRHAVFAAAIALTWAAICAAAMPAGAQAQAQGSTAQGQGQAPGADSLAT